MNDSSEIKINNPQTTLTHEQVIKSDRDIHTLVGVRDYLAQKDLLYVLADGYAVDAHCGGKISRPHGDMDVYVLVPEGYDTSSLAHELDELLRREDYTNWTIHQVGEDGHSAEFRENDMSKSFEEKRRLEVAFLGPNITPRSQTRTLMDSTGKTYEFAVEHIADLAAAKIIKLVDLSQLSLEERERRGLRAARPSDFNEIRRLLATTVLDETASKEALTMYFIRGDNTLRQEEAQRQASKYWEQVSSLLQNP